MKRKPLPSSVKEVPAEAVRPGGQYFGPVTGVRFFSSGCRLLDRVLGGGWAEGRVINVVGDSSAGKTLLAIEAIANFCRLYGPTECEVAYDESEAAFDIPYAQSIGMPVDRVRFNKNRTVTVEEWEANLKAFLDRMAKGKKKAGFYVLDSLDALRDEATREADFGEDSYGTKKPKLIGDVFARHCARMEALNVTLFIISQVRDKIGIQFGKKITRSGGRALEFYASQVLWLAKLKQITRTRDGVERKIGVWIKAQLEKSKVGLAWRDCEFPIRYAYGIDDAWACLEWLREVKHLNRLKVGEVADHLRKMDKMSGEEYRAEMVRIHGAVDQAWSDIELGFAPPRRKYA